ncbi:hypothetical protein NX059_011419 [Plenodomus lindquistii]|nr:hypothetical protein NX059_011419 [Plenodomus lindquistii]
MGIVYMSKTDDMSKADRPVVRQCHTRNLLNLDSCVSQESVTLHRSNFLSEYLLSEYAVWKPQRNTSYTNTSPLTATQFEITRNCASPANAPTTKQPIPHIPIAPKPVIQAAHQTYHILHQPTIFLPSIHGLFIGNTVHRHIRCAAVRAQ